MRDEKLRDEKNADEKMSDEKMSDEKMPDEKRSMESPTTIQLQFIHWLVPRPYKPARPL